MKLLLLCGSLRSGSTNWAVLRTVQQVAPVDVRTTLYTGLSALPHFNPDDDHDQLPAAVVELRSAIHDAGALLLCTPEYAGDMPGSFKNLLDWTVGGVETEGKPVAWINASAWSGGASSTHAMLRVVLTYTGCVIVEDACVTLAVQRTSVDNGVVIDADLRAAIRAVVQTLCDHVDPQAAD